MVNIVFLLLYKLKHIQTAEIQPSKAQVIVPGKVPSSNSANCC